MKHIGAEDVAKLTPYPALVGAIGEAFAAELTAPKRHHYDIDGDEPNGLLLEKSRRAIVVFVSGPSFRDNYHRGIRDWVILQVCVHEIGHALDLHHEPADGDSFKHIMLPSGSRDAREFQNAWQDAKPYFTREFLKTDSLNTKQYMIGENQKIVPCHPLAVTAVKKLRGKEEGWIPGENGPEFSGKTFCSA